MKVILCDNRECRRQLGEDNRNTLILSQHGDKLQIDLCDDCCKDLFDNIKNLIENYNVHKEKNIKSKENKVDTKKSKVPRKDIDKIITDYGVDKLIKRYQVEKVAMSTLAKELDISPSSLAKYLNKHSIDKKLSDVDIKITDIDEQRHDKNVVRLLKINETKSTNIPHDCRTCAYKNRKNNNCWYTMVTDKQAKNTLTECNHYVDIRKINND